MGARARHHHTRLHGACGGYGGSSHEHRRGDDHGPSIDLHLLEPCAAEGGAMFGGGVLAAKRIRSADDYVRRVRDQIEMIQYVRGRIGEDRGTILDMGRIPDYDTRIPGAIGTAQGQKRDPDSPHYSPVTRGRRAREPAPKRPPGVSARHSRQAMTTSDRVKRLKQHENAPRNRQRVIQPTDASQRS